MGKTHLGRNRKYSHHKYIKENEEVKNPGCKHSKATLGSNQPARPLKYEFTLRNVPNAVLNAPSIYNFTNVISVLLKDSVLKSTWNIIKHSELFLMLCTFSQSEEGKAPKPEKTIIINTDLTWRVIVSNRNVYNEICNDIPHALNSDSFVKLLDLVDQCTICHGIVDNDIIPLSGTGGRNGVFKDKHGNVKARNDGGCIRTIECRTILCNKTLCGPCKIYKKTLLTMVSNQKSKPYKEDYSKNKTKSDSHCPWRYLSESEKKDRINKCREDRHTSKKKMKRLEEKLKENLVALQEDDEEIIQELFNGVVTNTCSSSDPDDFKSLLVQQQQNILQCTDKRGIRWHPLIIRWCFELHSNSPKAYQMLKDSGILILPNERTLRDYSSSFKSSIGFDSKYLDSLKVDFDRRSNPNTYDNWFGIIHDEVSLRQELVFDDAGKLIGFVDLGSVQNSIDELEMSLASQTNSAISPTEATHMFVFMAVSLFSDFKMPVCFFPTTTIKSFALFNVFWKCIEHLELRGFHVLTSTCDGASPHRKFYKFHAPLGAPKGTLIYKTPNPFAEAERSLYFICDPVHLLKTTRNNWENSCWRNKTKKLRNNDMWITWLQLIDAFENDINESNASGLRILHKLKAEHLFLNPYLRMRVYLAAQVFSNRVAYAITSQGKAGTQETANFVQHMNDFFDCLNANRVYTEFEFKSVYRLSNDRRLDWLEKEFLQYFADWKAWTTRQTHVTVKEQKMYFISDQTWEGLQICVKSFVEVVRFALDSIPGVKYVVATKFNQDPLEKFFGKLRQNRGAYGSFTCKEFGQSYACQAFRNSAPLKSIRRLKRNGGALDKLDINIPLEKRKR